MRRLLNLEVKDKAEGELIARALQDPMTRAFVVIVGALLPLGGKSRTRVLNFVNDTLNEDAGRVTIKSRGGRHSADVLVPLPSGQTAAASAWKGAS